MKYGRALLPPLDYLLAFEAAAEFQSFVGASEKLNTSETAISRKVRLLEQHYGVALFLRSHRSISLTPQGELFLKRIRPAIQSLRATSRKMFSQEQGRPITLAATNSVATLWLMPRLQKFNKANKHHKIILVSSDNDAECLSDNVDLTILRGDGDWAGYHSELLFGETVFPVCSPDYLEKNPTAADLKTIVDLDLIEVSSTHKEWMDWRSWLAHFSQPKEDLDAHCQFNTYPLAVQSAVDGLGIALGWKHLTDPLLKQGKLVRPIKEKVRTDHGYYLLRSTHAESFDECQAVEDWLMSISAERTRYRG
ncbi:MAG: LysR family transcriptional regulator [Rhodobacteraceae bacterium]|nr:LysR family transcriptional regulator [Paracoccaceae bacterium]